MPRKLWRPGTDDEFEHSSRAEPFRILRSNIAVALSDLHPPTVIITSASAGDGKTFTSVNLAQAMARFGQRVVLVDVDIRHHDSHRLLGAHNKFGLTDVLLERRSLEDSLQFVRVGKGPGTRTNGLYFLAAGPPVSSPTELLASSRMGLILKGLAEQADIVLLDTPPILPVADTLVIGRMVAGAVLVVAARRTPVEAIRQAKDALIRNQTRLLGVVLNKMNEREISYRYGYGYGDEVENDLSGK